TRSAGVPPGHARHGARAAPPLATRKRAYPNRTRRPPVGAEIAALIGRLATKPRLGDQPIQGDLLKPGHRAAPPPSAARPKPIQRRLATDQGWWDAAGRAAKQAWSSVSHR